MLTETATNSPDSPENGVDDKLCVLVVDDQPAMLKAIAAILERKRFDVHAYTDPAAAIDFYAEHWRSVDVVLLDMTMPMIDGIEAFARMKKHNPEIQAILTSGYGYQEFAERVDELGIWGVLQKPFGGSELLAAIDGLPAT